MSTSNARLFFAIILSLTIVFSLNHFTKNPTLLKTLPPKIASSFSQIKLPKIEAFPLLSFNKKISKPQLTISPKTSYTPLISPPIFQTPLPTQTAKVYQKNEELQEESQEESSLPPPPSSTDKNLEKPQKPTKTPTPTPTPVAPPQYLRPGKTLEEIFKIAAEYACIPPEVLKAFIAQEAPGVLTWSDERARFYNAYDWWHRVKEKKEVCRGYGWYPETGLIAEDSLFAGERCKEPFSSQTANDTVSKSLGACQMLQYEWENIYAKKVKQKLKVEKVDRRVLFDCLLGFGIYLKENTRIEKCKNWGFEDIVRAACVNTGGNCSYYNYCNTICRNYNKFAKTHFNCDVNMESLLKPGGFCQFK